MKLAKLNNNLSGGTTDYSDEEQRREFRKEVIDNIIHIQNPSIGCGICGSSTPIKNILRYLWHIILIPQ